MSNKDHKNAPKPAPTPAPVPSAPVTPEKPKAKDDINYANPSNIVWPTDRHGMTSLLKREMLSVASRVGGDEDKLKLLQETLRLAMKHVHARFEETKANPDRKLKPKVTHEPEKVTADTPA